MKPATHPMHLVLGFVAWSAWFMTMYGGLSVACVITPSATGLDSRSWLNGLLLALALLTSLALFYMAFRCWRAAHRRAEQATPFVPLLAAGVYVCAALATLAVGIPVLVLPPCI